jgi:hypothetical protein
MKPALLFLIALFAGCACPPPSSPAVVTVAPASAGDHSAKEAAHLAGGAANLRTLDSLLSVKN